MIYCFSLHALIGVMLLTLIYYFITDKDFDYEDYVFFLKHLLVLMNFIS